MANLLTASDVAEQLSVHKSTVYDSFSRGDLVGVRLGKKCIRFRQDDVDRFVEDRVEQRSRIPISHLISGIV